MIQKFIAVALGGSIGALLRYATYLFFEKSQNQTFPWATLIINLTGAFLIGFIWGILNKFYVAPGYRLFIFVGILGSFTTFSTFAFDVFNLSREAGAKQVITYILATNLIGISLAFIGYYLSRLI